MNYYIFVFKNWYEARPTRERILIMALGCAIIYAFFSLMLYHSLTLQKKNLLADIKEAEANINNWQTQLSALNQIAKTPLYQEWLKQHQAFETLQGRYKFLKQDTTNQQWQEVIRNVLQAHNNITLVQMKNKPEAPYNPSTLIKSSISLYQQQIEVVLFSNYLDTINYLQHFEQLFPNIHWENLTYDVVQYPIAKIDMEFSIIYEKH